MKTYTQPPPWKNDPSSSTTRPLGNRHALVENLNEKHLLSTKSFLRIHEAVHIGILPKGFSVLFSKIDIFLKLPFPFKTKAFKELP